MHGIAWLVLIVVGCGSGTATERGDDVGGSPVGDEQVVGNEQAAGLGEAPPRGHLIRLERRPPVGTRWTEEVERRGRTSTAWFTAQGSSSPVVRERHYAMRASLTVTESGQDHETVEVEILSHTHRDWHGPGTDQGLPAGTTLTIERSRGDGSMSRGGRPLDEITIGIVNELLGLQLPDVGDGDDILYATDVPRAVGERWTPNESRIREILHGATVDRAQVRLDRVEDVAGVACDLLVLEVSSHSAEQRFSYRQELFVPQDPTLPIVAERSRTESLITEGSTENPEGQRRAESLYTMERSRTLAAREGPPAGRNR